jgi:hypothetical protein
MDIVVENISLVKFNNLNQDNKFYKNCTRY